MDKVLSVRYATLETGTPEANGSSCPRLEGTGTATAQPGSNSQSALPVGPTSVTIKSWHRRMYLDQGAARLPFIVIVLQLMADSGQTSAKPIHWNGTSRVSKSCHWCRKKQKTGFKLAKKCVTVCTPHCPTRADIETTRPPDIYWASVTLLPLLKRFV